MSRLRLWLPYLSDFPNIAREKEAPFVHRPSSLASACLGVRGGVGGSPRHSSSELPRPSECQALVEETEGHHQAHQEGPGAKSPTTKEPWTTDHDQVQLHLAPVHVAGKVIAAISCQHGEYKPASFFHSLSEDCSIPPKNFPKNHAKEL